MLATQTHDTDPGEHPGTEAACDAVLDRAQAALVATQWNPHTFTAWLPDITGHAAELEPAARIDWMIGLREIGARQRWSMPRPVVQGIFDLAVTWDDWPLAIETGELLAQRSQLTTSDHANLCRAYLQMGQIAQSVDGYTTAALERPRDHANYRDYCAALHWWQHCAWYPFFDSELSVDQDLRLEVLGEHHLRDFAWQYFDPRIAERCALPHFQHDDDWREWLDEGYRDGDRLVFAVLDHEWGFVGSVGMYLHEDVGFFYYWIGADFQGNGFGPRAGAMMLRIMEQCWDMRACYTKVLVDNAPSRSGLAKLGFECLDINGVEPFCDEIFYRRGPPDARHTIVPELHTLLDRIDSATVAASPVMPAPPAGQRAA